MNDDSQNRDWNADAKLIYEDYDSCIRKIERVKLLMEMEESVNGNIALTFELGCVLRDLRKEKEELEREVAVLSRLRKKIISEALTEEKENE
jgi:hypothetical protein